MHREEARAYARVYRTAHPEKVKADNRAYADTHREEAKAYQVAYRAAHRDVAREYYRKAKAKRRGARFCDHPACLAIGADRLAWQSNPHTCYLCGATVDSIAWMDHVVPISKGGIHCADNLRPACGPCNVRKGAKVA
jgi:5-methylcytosine-specific restriction endonuclease McrA